MGNKHRQTGRKGRAWDALVRMLLLAGLWWILNPADPRSWAAGVPAVLAAVWLSLRLTPSVSWHWSWGGFFRFAAFFIWQSFLGGLDVARRAFHPRMPLKTGFVDYPIRLPAVSARVCLANVISLLPGTLCVRLGENHLTVHALDTGTSVRRKIQDVEARVADLFAVGLLAEKEAGP